MSATKSTQHRPDFLFIQHDASCPPQLGAKALQQKYIDFKVIYANYPNAFSHIHPSMFKGIIVLGGHMAAWEDDKHPWLTDLKSFLMQSLDSNVPILGLCLGAQLLAYVIGSKCYVGDKGQEFGYFDVDWTQSAENDIFCKYIRSNGLDKTMPYSHGDTFSINSSNKHYTTNNGKKLKISVLARTKTPYDP